MRTSLFARTLFGVALAAMTMATAAAGATSRPAASYYTPAAVSAMGARYQAMADWYLTRPAASYYTPAALGAMGARYQALADRYLNRPAASYYTAAALGAMGERWQAVANYYAARPAQPTPFQWNDALVGAAVAVGVVIGLWAMLSVARGHAHLGRHSTAH